jgi:hypothetical protein
METSRHLPTLQSKPLEESRGGRKRLCLVARLPPPAPAIGLYWLPSVLGYFKRTMEPNA